MASSKRVRPSGIAWSVGAAGPLLRLLADNDFRAASWLDFALCAEVDPELFFPEKGGSTREARAVCRECPVTSQCLEWALENDERFGIFGGKTERERRKIQKHRAAASGEVAA